jgi:hypothetical protein
MPLLAAVLVACAPKPEPRTVLDFMDDGLAREGVLTRCNQNRERTLSDEECNNARRAAATIAIEAERARAPGLEQQSEAKLVALRDRQAGTAATGDGSASASTFGSPVGSVLPSMSRSPSFDVYADGSEPLGRPAIEVDAATPPANDLVIAEPQLEVPELAVIPRPFRDDTAPR